jgi:cyclase
VETEFHGANVAFIVTGEGVILIDTPMLPNEARAWLQIIREQTGEEIIYILNTDHHRGHVIGNQHFPMAKVVAHEYAWKNMKSYGDSFRTRLLNLYRDRIPEAVEEWEQHLEITTPEITFTDRIYFFKGNKEIHVIPLGGHTRATSVIFMPNDRLLFTGDAVVTDRPPFLSQSNTKRWLQGLTYLRKLRYDILVPGHGELTGKEATETMSEFLRLVRRRVRSAYASGLSKADTARDLRNLINFWPIPPFEKPKAHRRFKSSLNRVWNEMKFEARVRERKAKARAQGLDAELDIPDFDDEEEEEDSD